MSHVTSSVRSPSECPLTSGTHPALTIDSPRTASVAYYSSSDRVCAGGAAAEQQYSLRWNDFHSAMVSSFRRLRDEEDFVDVTLACAGATFSAHKVDIETSSELHKCYVSTVGSNSLLALTTVARRVQRPISHKVRRALSFTSVMFPQLV